MMIFMPPGSAKSSYASIVFPSYFMRNRNKRIILVSYGSDLAMDMGRKTRQILRSPLYKTLYETCLRSDSQAVDNFNLTNGSQYIARGILSGITGRRAHGIIIDDPVKGMIEAESETVRNNVFNAYESDVKTRLIPGGWIAIIQTRWHEDDLSGRILPDGWNGESGDILCKDGNVWRVLCLQARCEVDDDPLGRKKGEYLWPEWFDAKHWAQFENNTRVWSSLYQQLPSPSDGDIFKVDKIIPIDAIPHGSIEWCRGWDLASTTDGNHSVGLRLGKHESGLLIISDVTRFRFLPDERDNVIINCAAMDGYETKISIPQDPGQAGKTQVLYLTRRLGGYNVIATPESGEKRVRAAPIAAQMNVGNVAMVKGSWNRDFREELRGFPYGTYDDQVDALSRAYAELIDPNTGWYDL